MIECSQEKEGEKKMKVILNLEGIDESKVLDAKVATCADCKYFIQHYVKRDSSCNGSEFSKIYAGHCTTPRIKYKKPDDKACKYFELR